MHKYEYQVRDSRRKRKKLKFLKLILVLTVIAGLCYIILTGSLAIIARLTDSTVTKGSRSGNVSPLGSLLEIEKNDSKLSEVIEPILKEEQGEYAVVIENLTTGETFELNSDREFLAASLYKLWVMAAVFEKMEQGTLDKDDVMAEEVAKLNEQFDIATESAELTEGSFSMSVTEALNKMITVSHNYAALLLSRAVRLSSVASFMDKHGYDNSSLNPPTTTAADIAIFYKDLYERKLVSPEASIEMMELLKKQEWNDRIPKYLPAEIVSAHKTGELDQAKHDAGIVFTENGNYIIVLMSETNSQANAAEVEARISEAVYNYFNN